MAKQTFTTGQVLTAAQMTSLQETAMGGGPAIAKTANYVLVAADAGTTVAMNAAGSTTITVNTGLFAAGDTVFIQNLGAGACTVTAGTATVATAGSLILPQNDAGILYFTATGAAIFYDYIQAGAVSPLTTKGDLYTFSTSDARLGVGANGTTLVADSSEATGLKWQAASGGSNIGLETIVAKTAFSAVSALDIDSIFSSTYENYRIMLYGTASTSVDLQLAFRASGSTNTTASNYRDQNFLYGSDGGNIFTPSNGTNAFFVIGKGINTYGWSIVLDVLSPFASSRSSLLSRSAYEGSANILYHATQGGVLIVNTSYDGIRLTTSSGTVTGNYIVYGYGETV